MRVVAVWITNSENGICLRKPYLLSYEANTLLFNLNTFIQISPLGNPLNSLFSLILGYILLCYESISPEIGGKDTKSFINKTKKNG
jgi:hypothetical protein